MGCVCCVERRSKCIVTVTYPNIQSNREDEEYLRDVMVQTVKRMHDQLIRVYAKNGCEYNPLLRHEFVMQIKRDDGIVITTT